MREREREGDRKIREGLMLILFHNRLERDDGDDTSVVIPKRDGRVGWKQKNIYISQRDIKEMGGEDGGRAGV